MAAVFAMYVLPAAQAMTIMAVFVAVGLFFGRYPRSKPLLRADSVQFMATSIYYLFTPALVFGTYGAKLTWSTLTESGACFLWSAVHILTCFLVAKYVVFEFYRVEPHLKAAAVISTSFNNSASLPLLVVVGLAKSPQLREDSTALERATLYVFLYALVWNFLIWSVGLSHMEAHKRAQDKLEVQGMLEGQEGTAGQGASDDAVAVHPAGAGGLRVVLRTLSKTFLTPPTVGIMLGCVVGLNGGLRDAIFSPSGPLSSIGSVVNLLGACSVPVANLVLAGSLHLGLQDALASRKESRETRARLESEAGDRVGARAGAGGGRSSGTQGSRETAAHTAVAADAAHAARSIGNADVSIDSDWDIPDTDTHTDAHTGDRPRFLGQDPDQGQGQRQGQGAPVECVPLALGYGQGQYGETRIGAADAIDAVPPATPHAPPYVAPHGVSWQSILVLAGTRLVLCPALLFAMFAWAESAGVPILTKPGQDPVLRLVILLEAASPCAQTVLLLAETVSASQAARDMSITFLFIYPASLLSMTAFLALAMAMVFPQS